jgi:hypothetical protein
MGTISFREALYNSNNSMVDGKNDQMNTARNILHQSYNDLGKTLSHLKPSHSKSIKNIESDSSKQRSPEDFEKAPNDKNSLFLKNRQIGSANTKKSKDF